MSEDSAVTLEIKGLDQILKALKAKPPVIRLGILGNANARSSKGPSNATIGAAHEFGTSTIPMRSFLRVPIADHLSKELESSGALDKDVLANVIKSGSILPWATKVAIIAQKIVLDAFSSSGFGKWAPWKNPNYTNNTGQILLDTQQLRNSISYEVKA